MKRLTITIFILLLLITVFSSCSKPERNNKKAIVCTNYPQYNWLMEILGETSESFEVTLLLNNRMDLHSYQPTAQDILKISTCDLFIYIGGESDSWVEGTLAEAINKDMVIINLIDCLGDSVRLEEDRPGMETEFSVDNSIEDSAEPEGDEHIWLSLRNAKILCGVIADELSSMDAANNATYNSNLEQYLEKLSMLDEEYNKEIGKAKNKTLLFGDRFPFRYLVDDYGIDYYAAFKGCSAETEASFRTIIELASKIDELGLKYVMVTESSDKKIAETIVAATKDKNMRILTLDSMQSVSNEDINDGTSYLEIMRSNLLVLKEALA